MPEHLTPPNGTLGAIPPCPLTHAVPHSSRLATSAALSRSEDQTDPPRPVSSELALLIASSNSEYLIIGNKGPNCSSSTILIPSLTSATNVYGIKYPGSSGISPPQSTLPPCFFASSKRSTTLSYCILF